METKGIGVPAAENAERRPCRKSFAQNYALAAAFVAILIFLSGSFDMRQTASYAVMAFMVIFVLMLLLEPEKAMRETLYTITDSEVIHTSGIFSKRQTMIPYSKIDSIKMDQSPLGRMLDFGDIRVSGAKDEIVMKGLDRVNDVYKSISGRLPSQCHASHDSPTGLASS